MKRTKIPRVEGGFTLIELLIVLAIAMVLLTFIIPEVRKTLLRGQMEGITRESNLILQKARYEAIKQNREVVVSINAVDRQIETFVDVPEFDPDGTRTDPQWVNQPAVTTERYATDHILATYDLPVGVTFSGPPASADAVIGFSEIDDGDPLTTNPRVAVFQPDGSIRDIGAFRFADTRGNYLQLRVGPAATGRVNLEKWDDTLTPADWVSNNKRWHWSYEELP